MDKLDKQKRFVWQDRLLIAGMLLPIVAAMVLKALTTGASDDISITGALVYFTIPMPLQDLPISENQVNSWLLFISLYFMCRYLTHGIRQGVETKRQHIAELIVEKCDNMVNTNMGEYFHGYGAFIAAIMGLSAFSSLLSLFGLFTPTSDMNTVGGWALLVFMLITYYKFKCGPLHYLKSFAEPVALLTPLNVISEFATPVSMAFRHYGNVLSGSVISVLVGVALKGLSDMVFGWLPGFLGKMQIFRIGIPAVLSIYFDLFSGCLQAFIFAMLTMLYVSGAFPAEEYSRRRASRAPKHKAAKKNY